MIVCSLPIMSFAADVYTTDVTSDGIVTYSNDFESADAGNYSKYGIATYKGSKGTGSFSVTGGSFMANNTDQNGYPTFRINFLKTDKDPKINSIADAKNYKIKFKMKLSPTSQGKLNLDCGGRFTFSFYSSTYAVSCNDGNVTAVEGAKKEGYSVNLSNSGANPFREYEIDVDKKANTAVFKIEGNKIYEDVPIYNTNDFNSLLFGYSKLAGKIFVDDIQVIVTDTATCEDTNYAAATNIDFENFGIGMIPNVSGYTSENEKIGGFENANEGYSQNGFAYIDYKYDDADPSTVNKYLKITKTEKGAKPFSVKRDINGVVGDYSVYDVSFKIKNDLGKTESDKAFIRVAGDDNANSGMVAAIRGKDGKVGWFDYATGSAVENYSDSVAATGKWTQVKIRVYRDENKADLYAGDMETPIAQNIKTNFKCGGNYLVFAPQQSATGSIGIDDIVITPVTKSNYALSYTTGTDDLSKYTTSGVSAQCKVADEITETPVIIIAEYGSDGRLVNIAKSQDKENGIVSASLSNVSAQTGENVSIMLWKSLENPVPLKKLIKLSPAAQ